MRTISGIPITGQRSHEEGDSMSAIKRYAEDLMGEEGFEQYLEEQTKGAN